MLTTEKKNIAAGAVSIANGAEVVQYNYLYIFWYICIFVL